MRVTTFNGFEYYLKEDRELTAEEKEELHTFLIKMYPAFASYYKKNRYYSTIKPQMTCLIREPVSKVLVGSGKFLWSILKTEIGTLKLFAFGVLIDTEFQREGLGTHLINLFIRLAGEQNADLLYGSSENPAVDTMLKRLGFREITCPVTYVNAVTGKREIEKLKKYAFEFNKGLIEKINALKEFDIGIGPM
jgi:ribosomal protein S18 acetylase RimI-like enzyme